MTRHFVLVLALSVLPSVALGQTALQAGIQSAAKQRNDAAAQFTPSDLGRAAQDSVRRPSSTPYVLTGALVGALAGFVLYQNGVEATQDGDFAFPFSLGLALGAGAIVGAYIGWVLRPM